ncbi:MAG TPA: Gfo/Idh/MocA family oxidoreductase [Thermomicrobiales bacterium]
MIRFGLIGCGDVAFRTYIPGVKAIADRATIVATFDPVTERAERAASLFPGASAYTSFDAFLAHPGMDGVFNLTPAPLHRETSAKALDAGLHVFSEKPIASTIEEGRELIAQAKRLGRHLLCAPAVMATGRFRWLKRELGAGLIGTPHLAAGQMANMGPAAWLEYTGDPAVFYSKSVGPLLDTGVYVLHAITGLLGPARRVQAFGGIAIPERTVLIERLAGQRILVEANDVMLVHLDFGENRFAQVLSSFAVPHTKAPTLEIYGSLGTVSISQGRWYEANGPVDLYQIDQGWQQNVCPEPPPLPSADHLIGVGPAHFAAVLRGEEAPILTAEHALHVLDIILKAQQSAREGRALELEAVATVSGT